MNSKKLWHAFGAIILYLSLVAIVSERLAALCQTIHFRWGVPFGIGIGIWCVAVAFLILQEKHPVLAKCTLPLTALSVSFLIGAYLTGMHLRISLEAIVVLALLAAACYLVFMLLMTIPNLYNWIWYQAVGFIVWITLSILICVFCLEPLLQKLSLTLPHQEMLLTFFLLLLGFLGLGSILEAESPKDLLRTMAVPAIVASGLIAVVVLLFLSEGDGCDAADCCDCGDCGGGQRKSAKNYSKTETATTLKNLSSGEN